MITSVSHQCNFYGVEGIRVKAKFFDLTRPFILHNKPYMNESKGKILYKAIYLNKPYMKGTIEVMMAW